MKLFCVILDMLVVVFLGVLIKNNGFPYDDGERYALTFVFALVLLNMFALFRVGKQPQREGIVGLFLKRKVLEEKAKIARLTAPE